MSILSFQHLYQDGGGDSCPTITLGDLDSDVLTIGSSGKLFSLITGGVAPYTINGVTGDTTNLSFSIQEASGDYYFKIGNDGLTTNEFGFMSLTPDIIDANGCPVTPREFTIEIWASFENSTPVNWDQIMLVSVSGLPATIGTGIRIESIEYYATIDEDGFVGMQLDDPTSNNVILFNDLGDLSGSNFSSTKFERGATTNIITGFAPYTGTFAPTNIEVSGFDIFTGSTSNGDWQFYFYYSPDPVGTIDYCKITFRPI